MDFSGGLLASSTASSSHPVITTLESSFASVASSTFVLCATSARPVFLQSIVLYNGVPSTPCHSHRLNLDCTTSRGGGNVRTLEMHAMWIRVARATEFLPKRAATWTSGSRFSLSTDHCAHAL